MALENFTTYTEVDAFARLTVTPSKATGVEVERDVDVYLYKDKGVAHYNDINIDFAGRVEDTSITASKAGMGLTSSAISTVNDFGSSDISVQLRKDATGSNVGIRLNRGDEIAQDIYTGSTETTYYFTLLRTVGSDTVTLKIYSDSGRTNLLDTLSVSGYGTGTKYRYLYGFVNSNDNINNDDWHGFIENMEDFSSEEEQLLFRLL